MIKSYLEWQFRPTRLASLSGYLWGIVIGYVLWH